VTRGWAPDEQSGEQVRRIPFVLMYFIFLFFLVATTPLVNNDGCCKSRDADDDNDGRCPCKCYGTSDSNDSNAMPARRRKRRQRRHVSATAQAMTMATTRSAPGIPHHPLILIIYLSLFFLVAKMLVLQGPCEARQAAGQVTNNSGSGYA
jgi:hypothetical protein